MRLHGTADYHDIRVELISQRRGNAQAGIYGAAFLHFQLQAKFREDS